jgi:hypothetical protein
MRHPVYHSAPIVPYLEYRFASIIDRRPDMANTVEKLFKSTDDLVGYVFDNLTDPICNSQRRNNLEAEPTYDVGDEPCLKINLLRFSEPDRETTESKTTRRRRPFCFSAANSVFVDSDPFVIIFTSPLNQWLMP